MKTKAIWWLLAAIPFVAALGAYALEQSASSWEAVGRFAPESLVAWTAAWWWVAVLAVFFAQWAAFVLHPLLGSPGRGRLARAGWCFANAIAWPLAPMLYAGVSFKSRGGAQNEQGGT